MLSFLHYHRYLFIALLLGAGAYMALEKAGVNTHFLPILAWDIGIGTYVAITASMLTRGGSNHLKKRARDLDVAGGTLFFLAITAAFISLYGTMTLLKGENAYSPDTPLFLALSTVVLSWIFMQIVFAVHYANHFYLQDTDKKKPRCGIDFCGKSDDDSPDFLDFLYFSACIGASFAVSDSQVTTKGMRRIVMIHSASAFFYATFTLALSVNIAAGVAGGQ